MSKSLTVELLQEMIRDDSPLLARKPSATTPVRDLPEDERRAYKAKRQAERRAALKERVEAGSVKFDAATARDALADAALLILASGTEGSPAIMKYLERVYHDQAGAPFTIAARARSGELKPKLLHIAAKSR
ncbi:hypothetical protein [Agrobacterium tumefaciens]|uniref:hypothetical protein n=1 Tax=Agrobacterium tumefaciens TaxID=358 RepID=UPI003BA0567D